MLTEIVLLNQPVITESDMQILNAMCEGKRIHEIAAEVGTGYRNIEHRMSRLKESFGCDSRVQLVAKLFRMGVLK